MPALSDLAQLDPELLQEALQIAKAERRTKRRRQIQKAVCRVRDELLSAYSERHVAEIIDALARSRRVVGLPPIVHAAVMAMLICELDTLIDMPKSERIRQIFE